MKVTVEYAYLLITQDVENAVAANHKKEIVVRHVISARQYNEKLYTHVQFEDICVCYPATPHARHLCIHLINGYPVILLPPNALRNIVHVDDIESHTLYCVPRPRVQPTALAHIRADIHLGSKHYMRTHNL